MKITVDFGDYTRIYHPSEEAVIQIRSGGMLTIKTCHPEFADMCQMSVEEELDFEPMEGENGRS